MNTLLIYPPWRQPFMPPLSLAALTGFLEDRGVVCRQRDLNLETIRQLVEPTWLQRAEAEILRRIAEIEGTDELDGETALIHQTLVGASLRLPALSRLVEDARQTLLDPDRFYQLDHYRRAMRDFEEALSVVSLAWAPCRFLLHGHRSAAEAQGPDGPIEKRAAGSEEQLLTALLEESFIPSITGTVPGLLLVLADYRSQLLPALTLLRLVRRRLPGIRTAMAGWMAEELLRRPPATADLSDVIDVLVSGRPEEPLLRLSRALETGPLDQVPGLVRRGPGEPPKVVTDGTLTANDLPAPSFSGLRLDRYFSPEPVLPVRASSRAAEQIVALGARHGCHRFLLFGGLDRQTADDVAARLAREKESPAWFGSLDRGNLPDKDSCHRLAAAGCVKLQLRVGRRPDPGPDMLDQVRRAVKFCPRAGIGVHLHCRLDADSHKGTVTEELGGFFTENRAQIAGPGFSFSCRVVRDGHPGPAGGGSPPDLYNDATAPVPGTAPGFGRDPGDRDLPPESPGEEQRWRLVREAGAAMGPCLTPGTAVHDFLYLAHYGLAPPTPPAAESPSTTVLEAGLVLRPARALVRRRFQGYDPGVADSKDATNSIVFRATRARWWAVPGDGYRFRPLPDLAVSILEQCDGTRTWEQAVEAAESADPLDHGLGERLVRMMLGEGLLET
jgi:hypothetical protein